LLDSPFTVDAPDIHVPELCRSTSWFGAKLPEGVYELRFQCYGVLRDEPLLRNLFEMFSTALQRLVQIDSAYENDPNVSL
jgi:hypothetical protein